MVTPQHLVGDGLLDRARRTVIGNVVTVTTKPWLNGLVPVPVRRRALSTAGRVAQPVPKGVLVERVSLGGVPTWRLTPPDVRDDRAVFALHGGGYNYGGIDTHGAVYGWFARELSAVAWLPDYRLLPEHPVGAPLEDALRAWEDLAGRSSSRVVVTGDSAGAGLALRLACEVRDRDLRPASCLVLHSPWVRSADVRERPTDRLLSRGTMRVDDEIWRSGRSRQDPDVSPVLRPLHDLPPTLVQWAAQEALHADGEELVAVLVEAGVEVTGEAYAGLWHDAVLQVPLLREATAWLERSADWASGHLTARQTRQG